MAQILFDSNNLNSIIEQRKNVIIIYETMGLTKTQALICANRDIELIIISTKRQIRELVNDILKKHT